MAQLNDLQKLVVQKVLDSYDVLRKKGEVLNLEEFCEKTGLDYSNFSKYKKGEKHIYPDELVRLTNEYPIDASWLLADNNKETNNVNSIDSNVKGKNNKTHNQIGDNVGSLTDEERIELITLRVRVESLQNELVSLRGERDLLKELYEKNKGR